MARRRLYLVFLLGWLFLTFVLTSIPNPRMTFGFHFLDKLGHLSAYAGMGFLCALWRRECGDSRTASVLGALLFVAFAGAVDEFHQRFIPGRSMDLHDWIADAMGGVAGVAVSAYLSGVFPFLHSDVLSREGPGSGGPG